MRYDVIVVGAGHAGCEAASAAARLGRSVALVTLKREHIARLSCNPAIGGLAKGHLVRELDALGGEMGRIADATCIQFRRLNTRKGLAVQSSRAQVDIDRYPRAMQARLAQIPNLTLIEAEVSGLRVAGGRVVGVALGDGTLLESSRVCLTTGTFLGGIMHRGTEQEVGGRVGDVSSHQLSQSLSALGLRLGRLKTGTPPRLDGRTIRWDALALQEDTVPEGRFSFAAPGPRLPQVACHMTYTNDTTHDLIRGALDRSPLFTGVIQGSGPRYCPSVEDKVVRFPERRRHLIFLEPEGLDTHRVYPNGLSTSLPVEVQIEMVRSVPGLEQAEILQPGYAVEYDYSDPRDLGPDLQHRGIEGLYLVGQVNGTSGYEEAAVQGFVAGVSAALDEPFLLARDEAYIGVLLDDLTSRGVGGEPYRMFTSRAEHRLLLREDNADRRLMQRGRDLGLVDDATWRAFEGRLEAIERAAGALRDASVTPTADVAAYLSERGLAPVRKRTTGEELLRRSDVEWADIAPLLGLPEMPGDVAEQVGIDVKYAGYIEQARRRADRMRRLEEMVIPSDVEWEGVDALSWEVRERLDAAQPRTLGQVGRLPGITPAALHVITTWLARRGAA